MAAFTMQRMGTPPLGRPPRAARSRSAAGQPLRARRELAGLGPIAQLRAGRLARRLPQLLIGLMLYGLSMALMIRSALGNMPWDVLHQGIARHLPLSLGAVVIAASAVVLLLWIPLREKPGFGTLTNAVLVGLAADVSLAVLPEPGSAPAQVVVFAAGMALNAVATALYLGSQLGAGPRDGLMTGLHRRFGWSIRAARAGLELTVVAFGFALGGTLGFGTVLYALAIGPMVQVLLPWAIVDLGEPGAVEPAAGLGVDPLGEFELAAARELAPDYCPA